MNLFNFNEGSTGCYVRSDGRDEWFQAQAQLTEIWSPSTETFFSASAD